MKKILAIVSSMVLMCSMFTACGSKDDNNDSSETTTAANGENVSTSTTFNLTPLEKRTTLRVAIFSGSPHSTPFYIADKMGFFDELNIDIKYESFINGPAMMEANSDWDICDVGGPGALNGMKNYDVHMIGICDYELNLGVFVRADSDIAKDPTNPEVWKGKTAILPTGTVYQLILLNQLKTLGLTQDDVKIVNMDLASGLTAFKAGEGDINVTGNAFAFNSDDLGYVRITDGEQLGLQNACSLSSPEKSLENNREAIEAGWMLYYLTWDWCNKSEENMKKAEELFYESSIDEGVQVTEDICSRELAKFLCPSLTDSVRVMTEEQDDVRGLADRKVINAENALFETLDFFITTGSYTEDDRANVLSKKYVDSSVAISCEEKLKAAGQLK